MFCLDSSVCWFNSLHPLNMLLPVIAEAVEKWKVEREAWLAKDDKEEEEEEVNIYAVNDEEVWYWFRILQCS